MAKILYYNKPPKPIDFPIDPDAEVLYVQDEWLDDFKAMNPDILIFKPYNFKTIVVNPLRGDAPLDVSTITYQDILDGTDTESKMATAKAIHDGINYFIDKKEDDVHLFLQAVEDEGVITFVDDDAFTLIDKFVAHNPEYTSNVKIEINDKDVYYLTNYEAGEYYNFSSLNPQSEVFYGIQLSGATVTYKTFTGGATTVDDITTEMVDDKLQANAIIDVDVFPTRQADIKEGTFYRKRNDHFFDANDNEVIPLVKYICDGDHVEAASIGLIDKSTGIPMPWGAVTDAVVENFITSGYVTSTEAIGDTPYSLYFIKVAENSYSHLMCVHNKALYHHEDGAWKLVSEDVPQDDVTIELVDNKLQANAIIEVKSLPTRVEDIKENTLYKTDVRELKDEDGFYINPSVTYKADGTHVQVLVDGLRDVDNDTLYEWINVDDALISQFVNSSYLEVIVDYGDDKEVNCVGKLKDNIYVFCNAVLNKVLYTYSDDAWELVTDYKDIKNCDEKTIFTNVYNKLESKAIIDEEELPTTDIKENTLYRIPTQKFYDVNGDEMTPIAIYNAVDGMGVLVTPGGIEIGGVITPWTSVTDTWINEKDNYFVIEEKAVNNATSFIKIADNSYAFINRLENTKVLYYRDYNTWKEVGSGGENIKLDDVTTELVNDKLQANAIIDVDALPTSGIISTTIYRVLEDVYKYNDEEIEQPQGYRGTTTAITVSESGITFDSTEYPFATLTDAQLNEITDKETCEFADAEWFKISANKYDYKTTVTKEQVYRLYHNPTSVEDEYVKIGGAEGGSADVEIDNTTITKVNDKLQANAIISVDVLPTTNIKEKSVYKIVDKAPEYIDNYYYNGSTTPMRNPTFYKGDGDNVTFNTTGATINGNPVGYIAITASQIALYEAQGWVFNVDYDEAECVNVNGATFDTITKVEKRTDTVYHDMTKYYYREDGNWVNHSVVNLSQELYDNLSTEQKTDGTIYVVDDNTPVIQGVTYDVLSNKPSVNGITLQGALSLEDLSLYSRGEVNALLGNKGQVEFVDALPATPTMNTWYYSKKFEDGTDVPNDKRVLYIVLEDVTVYNDMGIVGDMEMETGDTISGSEHLVTSSQVVKKEMSTKLNKYGAQVNIETTVDDATLWATLAQIGTDDKKTDSSLVFNAGMCYLTHTVSPTNTAKIFQFFVTGNASTSAINKKITLILPDTGEVYTKTMDSGTWQAWKGGKKYKHTLVRYNNDSFQYTMGWASVISNKKTMSVDDFKTWLNEKGYTTATNPYYWCGGCCGTTEVRNGEGTGKAYVGRVVSGVFYDGTNLFFKWDYNGTTQINPARCKIITEELN